VSFDGSLGASDAFGDGPVAEFPSGEVGDGLAAFGWCGLDGLADDESFDGHFVNVGVGVCAPPA
jgi:hypothetical protein